MQNILMPGWDQLNADIMTTILRAYLQGAEDMRAEQASEEPSKKLDTMDIRGAALDFVRAHKPRS